MFKFKQPTGSAQALLADFQTAFVALATKEAAKHEADRSENELLQHLNAVSSGGYLQPGSLPTDLQADMSRGSLDAHFKKVQAQQLDSMSNERLDSLQTLANKQYLGRRVVATQPKGADFIEAVWYDQRRGYYNSLYKRPTVGGTIEAILLDRNMLVVKPSWQLRLLNNNLQNYIVYVIDPNTVQPMITLALP